MDHWGDPWADNANDKSPLKNAVTSPLPPAFTFDPVPVSGFVDDAGWGNNDADAFDDWASPNTGDAASADVLPASATDKVPGSAGWSTVTYEEREGLGSKWPESIISTPQDLQKVDSEPSESSTVSQLEEATDQDVAVLATPEVQANIGSSVRSSTSPSEASRNDVPVESPRTSIEDERIVGKNEQLNIEPLPATARPDLDTEPESEATPESLEEVDSNLNAAATVGDTIVTSDTEDRSLSDHEEPVRKQEICKPIEDPATGDVTPSRTQATDVGCDKALLAQLFPLSNEEPGKGLDEHDDPIFSTSARKAWYRLTRKQTMREFNHGDDDDNYIRVTWTNSHVRADVHKVVSRWAREDRISGTGPGARASFYWDTPAPAESKAPFGHLRTQSSVPVTKTALPARQSLPPLAINQSAAFDWSSPGSADPWKIESPASRPPSTPLALKNPTVAKLQRQEGRAVSVDLTPHRSEQVVHKRTSTVSHVAPGASTVSSFISPSASFTPPPPADPWASLDILESPSATTTTTVATVEPIDDDDDDWGEMVQTPTLPTPQHSDTVPLSSETVENLSRSPSPGLLPKLSPPANTSVQIGGAEPSFPTPIVRLQSTVSPTSALFKPGAFVPLHAEQGPIGPGLLKPANRPVPSVHKQELPTDGFDTSNAGKPITIEAEIAGADEIPSQSSPPQAPSPFEPAVVEAAIDQDPHSTPAAEPATSIQASTDSWADADFSFFDGPPAMVAPQPLSQMPDPSDPLSFFNTPAQTELPPAASRSPPHDFTPAQAQTMTGTTSSSQRRKTEEDQVINDILGGLPDLSYMLKR